MTDHHDHSAHSGKSSAQSTKTARDPVCGMTVDPSTTPHHAEHGGKFYHFCSGRCREEFIDDPSVYLTPKTVAPVTKAGTIYTCPMHPQIRQVGPGKPQGMTRYGEHRRAPSPP